jgi:hypothetical protein
MIRNLGYKKILEGINRSDLIGSIGILRKVSMCTLWKVSKVFALVLG